MYRSVVGRRLMGRSVPLLMAALLLAFSCTPTPKPVVSANARAFRAARYEPALATRFIRRLQEKVQMGLALGGGPDERTGRVGRP